jgi:hypothetical protein
MELIQTGIEFLPMQPRFTAWPINRNFTHRSRRELAMKKKSRIERGKEIISSVKKEMDKPRLAASVRDGDRRLSERAARVVAPSRPAL